MKIDARGFACPQPVLMIKAELEKIEEGVITLLVDNKGSSINVKNFCEANGHTVVVKEIDGGYSIDVAKGYECEIAVEENSEENIVIFISGECIGNEVPELGKKLMFGFVSNIKNTGVLPKTIILVNNSVRMVTIEDAAVAVFKELIDLGVEVLACGACLEYFSLVDELKTGKVTDALTVASKLLKADKVVRV